MAQFSQNSLQKAVSYLPQELVLFRATLEENIRHSVAKLSDESLILSAKLSGLENFISKSSLGYNIPIQERGEGLSGGEKQAIGLARVFAKNKANIMLLDEPSNAMDSNNELLVRKSLGLFSAKKTMIIVSHKTTLLKLCERLILLEGGKVLLNDGYEEVMERLTAKDKNV
jgi:ATP-binding cassette subfamily C protein LapB